MANPLGFLVIKGAINTEDYLGDFSASGIEIKTLTLFNPDLNSVKGLGRILIEQALRRAQTLPRDNSNDTPNLFVTVSSDKQESLVFFRNMASLLHIRHTVLIGKKIPNTH